MIGEVTDCYIPQELFPVDNRVIGDPQLFLDVELGQTPGRPVLQADDLPQLEMRNFKKLPFLMLTTFLQLLLEHLQVILSTALFLTFSWHRAP